MATIAHLHLPGFYAEVERTLNPDLKACPVLVCSTAKLSSAVNDLGGQQRGSVVLDASMDARAAGVKPGTSRQHAMRICPSAEVVEYAASGYEEHAREVLEMCAAHSHCVEPLYSHSVFLDLSLNPDPMDAARMLAAELCNAGYAPLLGVASCKLMAKVITLYLNAQRWPVNHNRAYRLKNETAFLSTLPIGYLWPLDRSITERLRKLGIGRVGDLADVPLTELERHFGQIGRLIYRYSLGLDSDRVRPLYPPPSVQASDHLEYAIRDLFLLEARLQRLSERVYRALVRERLTCRFVQLRLFFADGGSVDGEVSLRTPAFSQSDVHAAARRALNNARAQRPVSGLLLKAHSLEPLVGSQLKLIEDEKSTRHKSLERAIHSVRERFGKDVVRVGSAVGITRREAFLERLMASWTG